MTLPPHVVSLGSALPFAAGAFLMRRLRVFGVRESESIMNFSRLGTLSCICAGSDAADHKLDRRDVCRGCGLEILPADPRRLDMLMSVKEIALFIARLETSAIRARNVDIPLTVRSLEQLNSFLDNHKPGRNRRPPRRPNARVRTTAARMARQ